jgi:DGQHR domain-containing protein
MTAGQLSDENKIQADVWSPANPEGYQRGLEPSRARLFAKFIRNPDNFSPPSILLSARKSVKFISKDGNYGTLEIPDSEILYEVDGQHRVEGIREALRRIEGPLNIALPVVIMCPPLLGEKEAADPLFYEAKQFVVINRTQKRVRVDVSDRFLARLTDAQMKELEILGTPEEFETLQTAMSIVDKLRKKGDSVWYQNIKIPGEKGIASQKAFTDSLETALEDSVFRGLSDDEFIDKLDAYWTAWRDLCPNAFDEPGEYVIQKTTGVFVLNKLFVRVAKWLSDRGLDHSKGNFYEALSNMTKGNSNEFWHSNGEAGRRGTNRKAFNALAKELEDAFIAGNVIALERKGQ